MLKELDADRVPQIRVYNKIDKLDRTPRDGRTINVVKAEQSGYLPLLAKEFPLLYWKQSGIVFAEKMVNGRDPALS